MNKKINDNIKLALFWVFSFIIIIFIMSLRVNAATQNSNLPYVCNANYSLTDEELVFISDVLEHFNFHSLDEPVIIFKEAEGWWYDYSNNVGCLQYRLYFPTVTQQALLPSNTWHDNKTFSNFVLYDSNCYFDINFIDVPSMRITKRGINQNYNNAWEVAYGVDSSVWRRFYGTYEVIHENNISGEFDWVPNYPIYTNFSWGTSDGYNQDTFLTYFVPSNSVNAIPPNFDNLSPVYNVGQALPGIVPPNLNLPSYSWTTKPTLDFSTLEKAVESCADLIEWVGDNIANSFSNIIGNIQSVGNNITQTIQYYGNLIIENIQNGITNFYENMQALIEPIYQTMQETKEKITEFADLFIHPFDEEEFEEQIDNCALITEYNTLLANCEVIKQILIDAEEKDSFILYIDFENPFADSEHKIITSEINFNWLVPLRLSYRPFLWVFTLLECFLGGFRLLGNIIGGKAK